MQCKGTYDESEYEFELECRECIPDGLKCMNLYVNTGIEHWNTGIR